MSHGRLSLRFNPNSKSCLLCIATVWHVSKLQQIRCLQQHHIMLIAEKSASWSSVAVLQVTGGVKERNSDDSFCLSLAKIIL